MWYFVSGFFDLACFQGSLCCSMCQYFMPFDGCLMFHCVNNCTLFITVPGLHFFFAIWSQIFCSVFWVGGNLGCFLLPFLDRVSGSHSIAQAGVQWCHLSSLQLLLKFELSVVCVLLGVWLLCLDGLVCWCTIVRSVFMESFYSCQVSNNVSSFISDFRNLGF